MQNSTGSGTGGQTARGRRPTNVREPTREATVTAADAYVKARDELFRELQFLDKLLEAQLKFGESTPNRPVLWVEAQRECWYFIQLRAAEYVRTSTAIRKGVETILQSLPRPAAGDEP
jgi:hypothetical protein